MKKPILEQEHGLDEDESSYNSHYVDIPPTLERYDPEVEIEWVNVGSFKTREEALKFAQEMFGADENGCICLLTH